VKSPAEGAGGWFDPFSHEKPERALSLVSLLVIAETHQPGTVPVIAPAPPAPCKDFMNLKEAAAYFGVSYWSIRGLIAKGFIDAKTMDPQGFLDRCTEKQRSARYVDLNRRAPGECQRCSVSNPISEASRASDLGDDQGSDLRRICLTRLFATLTRFDRESATDVSRKKGTGLGGFGKNGK